jgi:hypothetical protein
MLGWTQLLEGGSESEELFLTLKNSHNFPGTKFAVNAAKKGRAIGCGSMWGPCFSVIAVVDTSNENDRRCAFFDGESNA